MPRRKHTGGKDVSFEEMAKILNMEDSELMVLVKGGLAHREYKNDDGTIRYRFTVHEVLALVSPLPDRPKPVAEIPVIEDEEDAPTETVRPEPRMESKAPPEKKEEGQGEAEPKTEEKKKPVKKDPKASGKTTTKTTTKPKK